MPIPSERIRYFDTKRDFGDIDAAFPISGLTNIQTDSYTRLLQKDEAPRDRKDFGIEEVLREIFPVESYDGTYRLEYVKYELGKPRYNQTECRQLRLTYGRPLRVWMRLEKEQPVEEEVYLGDLPIMIGGGEFIVNGAERCVVSQLHRSPGVDFVNTGDGDDATDVTCRIIPERGSWVEMVISKKGVLQVRIDQSGKFSCLTLLRAMDPKYGNAKALMELFFDVEEVKIGSGEDFLKAVTGKTAADDLIYPVGTDREGEIMVECGHVVTEVLAKELQESGLDKALLTKEVEDPLIITTLLDDTTNSHEEALLRIYQRLRPGNPPALEKAKDLFAEKFHDVNRYRLGRVGRFRINRKFNQDVPDTEMTLRVEDLISAIQYILDLRAGRNEARVDDIDNLG
ncbi:MAG: DNA-directed RNA polymerase subunit beta, partial [Planctomycetota bacterium]